MKIGFGLILAVFISRFGCKALKVDGHPVPRNFAEVDSLLCFVIKMSRADNFSFPNCRDQNDAYAKVVKIGQGTFG